MTDVLQPSATSPGAADTTSEWPEGLPKRMTLEEYLAWNYEDVRAEWVDGEVVLMSPVAPLHQRILLFLARLLADFCEEHELGDIYTAGVRVLLSSRPSGREPDVIFIAAAHADRVKATYIDGPADLAVEIISPESEERDRGTKLLEYEAAGVREYWLIDSLRHDAMFYVLGEDGRYHLRLPSPDGIYQSSVVEGFRLRPDWLWREPLPTQRAARAELHA